MSRGRSPEPTDRVLGVEEQELATHALVSGG